MAEFEIDVRKLTRQAMRSLKWRLRLTRASLLVERVAWCFWPLIAWTLAFFAIGKLGLLLGSTQAMAISVVGAGVVGFLWLFAKGVRVFRWPSACFIPTYDYLPRDSGVGAERVSEWRFCGGIDGEGRASHGPGHLAGLS